MSNMQHGGGGDRTVPWSHTEALTGLLQGGRQSNIPWRQKQPQRRHCTGPLSSLLGTAVRGSRLPADKVLLADSFVACEHHSMRLGRRQHWECRPCCAACSVHRPKPQSFFCHRSDLRQQMNCSNDRREKHSKRMGVLLDVASPVLLCGTSKCLFKALQHLSSFVTISWSSGKAQGSCQGC